MLMFLSDVHLTDGSSGETIKPTAFTIFADQLKKIVETASPLQEVRIVLLGDIFDIIRSTQWLTTSVRPWDPESDAQKAVVENILTQILAKNADSLTVFGELRNYFNAKRIPFEVDYIIGNHDWIVNRYPSCRRLVAKALGIPSGTAPLFPCELFEPDYKVFARHGDIYDKFNNMGDRNASSLGDAIVIELLNKYPQMVEAGMTALATRNKVTSREQQKVSDLLKELDNIRPILDAPAWVLMVMNKCDNQAVRQLIEKSWEQCVDEFFEIPFIKNQDIPFLPDTIDLLQVALHLSSRTSKKLLEKVTELKDRFIPSRIEGDYHEKAFIEPRVRSREANFVLYGHTHNQLVIPMDQEPTKEGSVQDKVYFNTGTWRKTWNKVVFDPASREFVGWHVLSYVALFKPEENGPYNFEVWNGALG
ncbi:MAG: hypothetical protein EHM79_06375 [Geobacter sp.]|nr:MAG: hypothetical protein EHM79_06375 [Geobacter sp.]